MPFKLFGMFFSHGLFSFPFVIGHLKPQIRDSSGLQILSSPMDFRYSFCLLVITSLLCPQSKADGSSSVLFVDGPNHQYLRSPPSDAVSQTHSMLLSDVGASVSVLLGFAPPATLTAASSSRLNEVLMPNPFHRPRSVFMLDVRGAEDSQVAQIAKAVFGSAFSSRVIMGSNRADIQLPDEDEVSVISLNEPLSFDSDVELTDKELSDFASWLDGTYITSTGELMNGEFTIPLASGGQLNLHMSKKADRVFITCLVSLIRNIQKAMDLHQDLSGSMRHPAELLTGSFAGIKALQEEYGTTGVTQEGLEVFFASISKIFDSLQSAYKGQMVGVFLFNGAPPPESETVLNVMLASRPSARWLQETEGSSNSTISPEVMLVRRTLAWITGIILLIATLLGIYYLMYMPLTRDTLLYSNVKLD